MQLASIVVDNSHVGPDNGAVYKGLAFGVNVHGSYLFAANFRAGTIDVYDSTFTAVLLDGAVPNPSNPTNIDGRFTDPDPLPGFAPHGIHNINGDLYVAYAKQDAPAHDDVARTRFRIRQLLELQHRRPAEFVNTNCFHVVLDRSPERLALLRASGPCRFSARQMEREAFSRAQGGPVRRSS